MWHIGQQLQESQEAPLETESQRQLQDGSVGTINASASLGVASHASCNVCSAHSGTLSVPRASGALRPWMLGAQGLVDALAYSWAQCAPLCAAGSFGDRLAAM